MAIQVPFNADGINTATSIVADTFNFTDGEAVSLRPELRKVDGNLVATTNIVMSSDVKGVAVTSEGGGSYDVYFNEPTGDVDGNIYVVGGNEDTYRPTVFSFNSTGNLRWKVGINQINNENARASTIAYSNGFVTVAFRFYDSNTDSQQVGMIVLSAVDGTVEEYTVLASPPSSNPEATSLAFSSSNQPILVGATGGEYTAFENLTVRAGSTTNVLWLDSADISVPVSSNGQWQVYNGSQWVGINSINQMVVPTEAISGTGSGQTVSINWTGVTNKYQYVNTQSTGTGYVEGDRIRVRGSQTGGVDNTDITATATSFSDPVSQTVAVFDKATYPNMGAIDATWLAIFPSTGLIQQIASIADMGATWELTLQNGAIDFTDPVLLTGGGNDAFLYIYGVYSGNAYSTLISQDFTSPSKIRFEINDGTDFSTGGPYSVRVSLQSQAYIWTPNWQHTYGGTDYDYVKDVAVDSNSGDIYLYCEAQKYDSQTDTNYRMVVLKLDSNGNTQWAKYVEDGNSPDGNLGSIAVDSDGNVFTVSKNDNGYTFVTKLDSSGSVIWQVRQDNDSNWDNEPRGSVDSEGNVYVAGSWYDNDEDYNVVSVMKLSGTDGSLIWARFFGNEQRFNMNEYYNDDCQLFTVVGTNMLYTGYCYDVNDERSVGLVFSMPTNGEGIGQAGRWKYWEDANAAFVDCTGDAYISDTTFGTPVDVFSQTVDNSPNVDVTQGDVGGSDVETREAFGSGGGTIYSLAAIRWGDGTTQTTFHHNHGNYNFVDDTFNMPSNAQLNSSGQVTIDVGDLTVETASLNYSISYGVQYNVNNYYNVNAYAIQLSAENSTMASQNVSKVVGYNGGAIVGSNNNDEGNWKFLNRVLSYPASMSSRIETQGAVATVMGDTIAASGHAGYISSQQFYTASSAGISAVKVMARITMDNNVVLQTFLLEYMFVRDYSGGPTPADRVNDVVTASRIGHASTTVETTESTLVGSINSQGRLQVRVNMATGGNSGSLTYTAQEFEVPDGYMGGMYN